MLWHSELPMAGDSLLMVILIFLSIITLLALFSLARTISGILWMYVKNISVVRIEEGIIVRKSNSDGICNFYSNPYFPDYLIPTIVNIPSMITTVVRGKEQTFLISEQNAKLVKVGDRVTYCWQNGFFQSRIVAFPDLSEKQCSELQKLSAA